MTSKKFTLKMAVEDIPDGEGWDSPDEVHFGVPWALQLEHNDEELGGYLRCSKEKDLENPWSIHVTYEMRVVSAKRGVTNQAKRSYTFNECVGYGWDDISSWEEATQDTTADNPTMVYCEVTINKMTGIAPKKLRSFEEPDEHLTYVILKVDDQKFHVSKVTLAGQSSYFKTLFFGDFNEAKKSEIELKDLDPDVFQNFLEVIYGHLITAEHVVDLLKLADIFDAPLVRDRCEEYILRTDHVDNEEKLRLADVFKLEELMQHCLNSMETSKDLKSFLPASLNDLSHSTLVAIFERNLLHR